MTKKLLPILVLLAIMYLLILIKLLSTILSDIFIRPVDMIMQGLELLDSRSYPLITDDSNNELGRLIKYFNTMVEGMRQRKILERFISEEVSETIAENANQNLQGRQVYRVIMFIHIGKFEDICEDLLPEAVISLLNHYFSTLEPAIIEQGGQIDKYIADAIMISFADERTNSQPEAAAVKTANNCIKMIPELNKKLVAAKLPMVKIGVGIAAGQVISGQIGAYRGRKDFTLIGDAVNLAARLESISHFDQNSHVMVSKQIEQKAFGHFKFKFYDKIKVKGKNEPVEVFELPQPDYE